LGDVDHEVAGLRELETDSSGNEDVPLSEVAPRRRRSDRLVPIGLEPSGGEKEQAKAKQGYRGKGPPGLRAKIRLHGKPAGGSLTSYHDAS
jgi:hypothetical protein